MTAPRWGCAAAWWVLAAMATVWWVPSLLLTVAALVADRARFRATSALARALRAAGARGSAEAVLRHELRRCRSRAVVLADRMKR